MFVPWAEQDRNLDPIGGLQRVEEICHLVEPREELLMLLSTLQHSSHRIDFYLL